MDEDFNFEDAGNVLDDDFLLQVREFLHPCRPRLKAPQTVPWTLHCFPDILSLLPGRCSVSLDAVTIVPGRCLSSLSPGAVITDPWALIITGSRVRIITLRTLSLLPRHCHYSPDSITTAPRTLSLTQPRVNCHWRTWLLVA